MATSVPVNYELNCCDGIRGDVDMDGIIDIKDLVNLTAYVFTDGERPECIEEADVNGSGDKNPVNEDDFYYLAEYMFARGPEPPKCPDYDR